MMKLAPGAGVPSATLSFPHPAAGRARRWWTVALTLSAVIGCVLGLVPQPAIAGEPVLSPGATVSLLEGGADRSGTARFGLAIDIEPGWKTYWRSPGEGGFPGRLS